MRRWFLGYHSPDLSLAERLKAAIERRDPRSSFFCATSLRAGGFWSAQLAQEIEDATAFILLVGERGVGNWQMLEYDEALDKRMKSPDFPMVLVLLEGQTGIVTPDPLSEKDLARLFDAASGTGTRPAMWRFVSPNRGLTAMQEPLRFSQCLPKPRRTSRFRSAIPESASRRSREPVCWRRSSVRPGRRTSVRGNATLRGHGQGEELYVTALCGWRFGEPPH
jgi:hypothetical protein